MIEAPSGSKGVGLIVGARSELKRDLLIIGFPSGESGAPSRLNRGIGAG